MSTHLNESRVGLERNAVVLVVDPRVLNDNVVRAVNVPSVRVGGGDASVIARGGGKGSSSKREWSQGRLGVKRGGWSNLRDGLNCNVIVSDVGGLVD